MLQGEPTIAGRWVIRHQTAYRYTTQVVFAPHTLRLTPRSDTARCLRRSLLITPQPLEVADFTDERGNGITLVTFGPGASDELVVDSEILVETFVLAQPQGNAWLPRLPWSQPYPDSLFDYRHPDESAEVAALAYRLAAEVSYEPRAFFARLCQYLYGFDRQIRVEGAAQSPAQTLASGRGACRDLTVLYLAVCRSLGVAGRFVSGYQGQEMTPDGNRHLHAWPEVYVPELGWLGWDPTHGVPVGSGHVALCVAPGQAGTMPIDGSFSFNGPTVTSTLSYSIRFDPA